MTTGTPLAVTGIGSISPLGEGGEALATALEAGRSGLSEVAEEGGVPCHGWAGRIPSFDSSPYIPPSRARRLDRASRFAVAAAVEALRASGLAEDGSIREGLAVLMGTSSAGSGPLTVFLEALFRLSPEAAPPFEFPNTVANAPASHISIELGLRGPNTTLSHGESVLGQALLWGRLLLAEGRATSLLTGAVDEWNPYYQLGYSQLGALRERRTGGGGTVLSEGSTVLILEGEEGARRRGAQILARIRGLAVGSARGEPYRWVADVPALTRVITQALDDAGLGAGDVGSVFLGANGVEEMEDAEATALAEIFAGHRLAATGVKGAVGERAVSGALGLAAAVLARHRGVLPPYASGARESWPEPVGILRRATPRPPGATLLVLYGFGGDCAAIVLD